MIVVKKTFLLFVETFAETIQLTKLRFLNTFDDPSFSEWLILLLLPSSETSPQKKPE